MTWNQVLNITYPAWRGYPAGAGYERHTIEGEVWVWKDPKAAAQKLVDTLYAHAQEQGVVPLYAKAWAAYEPVLYDKFKVEFAVGRPHAATLPLGGAEVYAAVAPLLVVAGVIAAIAVIEWIRPGTVSDVVTWLVKKVGPAVGPVLKPLVGPALLLLGAFIVVQVVT